MRPIGIKDKETLLAMKQIEHEKLGLPSDGKFYLWDYRYAVLCDIGQDSNTRLVTTIVNFSSRIWTWTTRKSRNISQYHSLLRPSWRYIKLF